MLDNLFHLARSDQPTKVFAGFTSRSKPLSHPRSVHPARTLTYEHHEPFSWFRAAAPFADRNGHNDRSARLWQQCDEFRGVSCAGSCHKYLMFNLNWKKQRGDSRVTQSHTGSGFNRL